MTADWQNLQRHILNRIGPKTKGGLGWNWKQFEKEAGISSSMRYRMFKGDYKELTADTASRIERALDWTSGSAQACLDGGKPTLAEPSEALRVEPDEAAAATPPPSAGGANVLEILRWWARKVDTRFTREDMGQLVADFIALAPESGQNIPVKMFQSWAHKTGKVFTREDLGKLVEDVIAFTSAPDGQR